MSRMIPLSLYIHIPWCEKKCPYCDFNSHLAKQELNEPAYVDALLQDLDQDLVRHKHDLYGRPIQSIFIGGGTPSLFSSESIAHVLNGVSARIELTDSVEVTLEANPGSSEFGKFESFKQAGVNRLSVGVQSFEKAKLQALGRVHSQNDALLASRHAKGIFGNRFNLDLMYGLPEQSIEQAVQDARTAIEQGGDHLSCYQLTIEPNTLFHHQPPPQPDDEQLWDYQQAIQTLLAQHNFEQYEVSAYARKNAQCQHNLNYWQFGDYLGIGAGAHGKLTSPQGGITRMWKIKHPASYMSQNENFLGDESLVDHDQRAFEFMLNALRLTRGFNLSLFESRTGQPTSEIQACLEKHQDLGLINITDHYLHPTARGQQMIDSMLQDYLPNSG